MATAGRLHIGKQLFVGSTFPIPLLNPVGFGVGPGLTQGSAYFEGPTYMGHASGCFGDATLAVGRCLNASPIVAPAAARAWSLFKVSTKGVPPIPPTPIDVMLGDPAVGMVGIMVNSLMQNIFNATFMNINSLGPIFVQSSKYVGIAGLKIMTGAEIREALIAEFGAYVKAGKSVWNGATLTTGVETTLALQVGTIAAIPVNTGYCCGNKVKFDIPHATEKGKRIRHLIAEGPEPGIYIRGKLENESVIELPDYWNGLVDPETITVTLTPFGRPQSLYIDSIPYGRKIIIKSEDGTQPNCHYNVWVSRWLNRYDHTEKLHVVYDGETANDYPGDNKVFSYLSEDVNYDHVTNDEMKDFLEE